MRKTAIITGITGQDGSYLAEHLLEDDYLVYGVKRRNASGGLGCVTHLEKEPKLEIVEGDVQDLSFLARLCPMVRADEFYNLAAQSHVGSSFAQPILTTNITGLGVLNCLEAIRLSGIHTKFYQASTSELFGGLSGESYNEESSFHPRSPYGVAKLFGHWITVNYRESYKMFASTGILFNHESPRRGPNFVSRKITLGIAKILKGQESKIKLGNLDAKRDWGHAKDYVAGMKMILNHNWPDDFVLATGKTYSVRDFCRVAFEEAGLGDYEKYIEVDPNLYRPAEVPVLIGDSTKAKKTLGWEPEVSFEELVKEMVISDIKDP